MPGPPGNTIDIDPDGLSELTFGQLLVLFSKIDKAKKEGNLSIDITLLNFKLCLGVKNIGMAQLIHFTAAAAGNANPVTISPGTTAVKKQPGNLTTSRKKQPGSLPTARKNPPGSFPSTRKNAHYCLKIDYDIIKSKINQKLENIYSS